jgi:RNA-binding protein Nova
VDGVLRIHDFIMDKIKEKPDPNAKMAIDFDHKQPAEREKQVCADAAAAAADSPVHC